MTLTFQQRNLKFWYTHFIFIMMLQIKFDQHSKTGILAFGHHYIIIYIFDSTCIKPDNLHTKNTSHAIHFPLIIHKVHGNTMLFLKRCKQVWINAKITINVINLHRLFKNTSFICQAQTIETKHGKSNTWCSYNQTSACCEGCKWNNV